MQNAMILTCEFIEFIPEDLRDKTIYVSIEFATVVHKCCCGCGNEVVTPLSPTDWKLVFDGQSISLHPSIGNWNFTCQSHYWIRHNRVEWAPRLSQEAIDTGRACDAVAKKRYFSDAQSPACTERTGGRPRHGEWKRGFWQKLRKWFFD